MQSLQSLPGSWKDGFFSFPPTQAGQDSHSFTTAASSQFLLSAAWGSVAALAWGKRESLSSLEEKQETRELPCGRFWDTSCLFWPPRRCVEPNYASSLLQPCTTPLPRHQHWLVPYRCSRCLGTFGVQLYQASSINSHWLGTRSQTEEISCVSLVIQIF